MPEPTAQHHEQAERVLEALQDQPELLRAILELIDRKNKTLGSWTAEGYIESHTWTRHRETDNGPVARIKKTRRPMNHAPWEEDLYVWTIKGRTGDSLNLQGAKEACDRELSDRGFELS